MMASLSSSAADTVRAELVALQNDWANAIVCNDAERIAEFMADDWVIVSDTGISSKQHFLSLVRSGQLSHSAMALAGDNRIRVYADSAVLTARATNTAYYQGRRFDADEWTTDVFIKHEDRWLCVLTHITAATDG